MRCLTRVFPTLVVFLATSGMVNADDRYFLLVFAAQSKVNLVRNSHTWGTFVHMSGSGPDVANYQVADAITISWLPESMRVRTIQFRPQAGVNLDLQATMQRYAYELPTCITLW